MSASAFSLPVLTDSVWGQLSPLIETELGIKMPIEKKSLLQNRLLRRVKTLGLSNFEDYCNYLFSAEGWQKEKTPFFNEVTTNKTFFFREYRHFEFLSDRVIPEYLKRLSGQREPLRIWSAACSTGEEIYSIACIIEEYMRTENIVIPYEILGSDVSTKVLWHAHSAVYEEDQVNMMSSDILARYFMQSKDKTSNLRRVIPEIRQRVKLRKINLMNERYPFTQPFDVIFCRNVLIYFSREDIVKIANRCAANLRKGGYFFTGHADSIFGATEDLKRVEPSIFVKRG